MSDTSSEPVATKPRPHTWRRRALICLITVAVLWWPGVRLYYFVWITTFGKEPVRQHDFSQLARVLPPGDARLAVIYRGLPHQMWKQQELLRALFTSSNRSIGGYRFYSSPLLLPEALASRLSSELRRPERYYEYSGPKLCGGYHPDFCFEWKSSRGTFRALLCTGCDEIIIIGDGNELHCDMELRKDDALDQLLKQLREMNPDGAQ